MGARTGGKQVSAWVVGAVVAGLLVGVGGVAVGVLVARGGGSKVVSAANPPGSGGPPIADTTTTEPPPPITVTSVTPANNATGVSASATVSVTFSRNLSSATPMPRLRPAVSGSWARSGPETLSFTPSGTYAPLANEKLVIPGGPDGVLSTKGATLAKGQIDHFNVQAGSTLRLQQLMSMLGYSPLSWTPAGAPIPATDTAAQDAAAFSPPAGTFAWRNTGWPTNLTALWKPGNYNQLTKGLVMAFEADQGLTPDGVAGPLVWAAMFHALAAHQLNTGGYNFALTRESSPETLTIWHNGKQVFHSVANTGVSGAPTALGTFNVYERLRNQIMQGTNLDGSHYSDPVQFVAYFNGGDAVHYFPRGGYGSPQSLGCVELPLGPASVAWPYLGYGTIVQVVG